MTSLSRILVVGGSGFFGTLVTEALRTLGGVECTVGRRNPTSTGEVRVDLASPNAFSVFDEFDIVVNTSDTLDLSPVEAMRYCLDNGIVYIETTAVPATTEEVLFGLKSRRYPGDDKSSGTVLLGAGAFPGYSNLLAKELAVRVRDVDRLELAFRLSPLSAGGSGMIGIMLDALRTNSVRYETGERIQEPAIEAGFPVRFGPSERPTPTVKVGLSESVMLYWSLLVPSTGAYMAPQPNFLRLVLLVTSRLVRRSGRLARMLNIMLGFMLFIMRKIVFRWRHTSVAITALAKRRGTVRYHAHQLTLHLSDGVEAGAWNVAATIAWLREQAEPPRGVILCEEILDLNDILTRVRSLSGGRVRVTLEEHAGIFPSKISQPGCDQCGTGSP